jgi:hypothetical protein
MRSASASGDDLSRERREEAGVSVRIRRSPSPKLRDHLRVGRLLEREEQLMRLGDATELRGRFAPASGQAGTVAAARWSG